MSHAVIRLGQRHKKLLYAGLALLWLSGALWLAFHYLLQTDGDFGPQPHFLERWWLRLHGLAGMLALILLGSLLPNHMKLAWTRRRNHRSGLPMLAAWSWLAATGYALYYFSSDANASWLPRLHWGAGLALPTLLLLHMKQGRNRHHRPVQPATHAPSLRVSPAAALTVSQPASQSASS